MTILIKFAILLLIQKSCAGFFDEYLLVWNDEFDNSSTDDDSYILPDDKKWRFETGGSGWGNDEAEYYVDGVLGDDVVAKIENGNLIISAFKLSNSYQGKDYISARMNTKQAWTYGYFEMNAKLPTGTGTWPAFWMLTEDYESVADGEIDIMEHVGYEPGVVHFSVHTAAYNPGMGTVHSANQYVDNFDTEFHRYGVEWTSEFIKGYIDDVVYYTFENDHEGNRDTWPFDTPFYLKLNLAVGGSWGGYEGIDDSIFPASFEIDYVRVYQKKRADDSAFATRAPAVLLIAAAGVLALIILTVV